jgi:Cu2+-exporting ATPase
LRGYLVVVIIAGLAGAVWWWWQGAGIAQALQVMISVFVVSCPCALGVAAPLADDLAVSRAEKLGVFVRNLSLWKRLARVRKVIFDKTGTLTLENPVLLNPEALRSLTDTERSALRHLISGNLHPVSRSLFDALGRSSGDLAGEVNEEIGKGLSFTDGDGRRWSLARPAAGAEADTLFSCDGDLRAAFVFRDELRAETVSEVARLRGVVVLSFNELALALHPEVAAGDEMELSLIKPGKDKGQAVGYLADGSMIVVNRAADKIGETVPVVISGILPTSAGRLIFAELK